VADGQQRNRNLGLTSIEKVRSLFGLGGLSTTRGFARRHLWIWPLLAMIMLAATTFWIRTRIEKGIREQMKGELRSLLNADV
jgi:hypothetical protein